MKSTYARNGDRAVGTQLADDHPGPAYLRRGEPYRGPANLFGRKFFTAYEPVFGPEGETIGILYVGIPIEIYDTMLAHGVESMALFDGVGVLILLLLSVVVVRRSLEPLGDVATTITQLAEGKLNLRIAHVERKDEIGAIARSLSVFREATARNHTLEQEDRNKVEEERKRAVEIAALTREFQHKVAEALGEVGNTIKALEGDALTMRNAAETTKARASNAAKSAGSTSHAKGHGIRGRCDRRYFEHHRIHRPHSSRNRECRGRTEFRNPRDRPWRWQC